MNPELDEWLAVNVMGWGPGETFDWSPTTRIEQAIQCLDNLPEVDEVRFKRGPDGAHDCLLFFRGDPDGRAWYRSEARAKSLSIAVARAAGWQG